MRAGTPLRDGRPEDAGLLAGRVEAARRFCAAAVEEGTTPTLAVLAARRGVVVLHDAFGQREPDPGSPPLRRDDVFPICSLTKPITATLLMLLVEDGLVAVERPVREYLPELAGAHADDLLVHHLLTHTSGFDDEAAIVAALERIGSGGVADLPEHAHPCHHLLLSTLSTLPFTAKPGTEMIYGNTNYTLLGEIVKRASGRPIEVFARERLFEPLGMHDTDYVLRDDQREKLVRRALDAPVGASVVPGIPGVETEAWRRMPDGGGGVYSTVRDLAIFGQMFLDRGVYGGARMLSRLAVEEMVRDQVPGMGVQVRDLQRREASYGYGWLVIANEAWRYFSAALPPRGCWWHTGMGGARLHVDPVNRIVASWLEVGLEMTDDLEMTTSRSDRFLDVFTSAVDD